VGRGARGVAVRRACGIGDMLHDMIHTSIYESREEKNVRDDLMGCWGRLVV
jgi:hypothetical protein